MTNQQDTMEKKDREIKYPQFGANLRWLRTSHKYTQEGICKILSEGLPEEEEVKRGAYTMWEGGYSRPDPATEKTIANFYNISVDDLHNATDLNNRPMFTANNEAKREVNKKDVETNDNNNQQLSADKKRVPLFSVNASAGNDYEMDLAPVTTTEQYIELGDMLKSDSQAALYVFGNSMTPNYPSGCIVGLRQNKDGIIQPGEVYVIETESNRLLKRLYYNADMSGYECYSDNSMTFEAGPKKGAYMYPVFEVKKEQVRRLFDVTGMIKRNSNSAIMLRA